MQLYLLRIGSIVAVALAYMLFDVFNKRDVPSIFAYATLAYGFLLTVLYFNIGSIILSVGIALAILGVGYIVYRIGQLGAADVIEFAAISLILPMQGLPFIASAQYNVPFALSLLVNTGIVAIVLVPIYYIPKASRNLKKPIASYITSRNMLAAFLIGASYLAFMLFTYIVIGINYIRIAMLAVLMVSSLLVMLFSVPITYSMVEYVSVDRFDIGDIIALNLMPDRKIASLKKKITGFDRLVTADTISNMKKKGIKEKMPVYKNALPFALPIFIGAIVTLLVGNMMFVVLGI